GCETEVALRDVRDHTLGPLPVGLPTVDAEREIDAAAAHAADAVAAIAAQRSEEVDGVYVVAEDLLCRRGQWSEARPLGVTLEVEVETVGEEVGQVAVALRDVEGIQVLATRERGLAFADGVEQIVEGGRVVAGGHARCYASRPRSVNDLAAVRPRRGALGLAPRGRQPRLLAARSPRRPIVVTHLHEARGRTVAPPVREVVPDAVPAALPSLGIRAARVRREQDTARLQRLPELAQDARQLGRRHVEERGVREYAVEARGRQLEGEEVLMQDLAPRGRACHRHERRRAVKADGDVAVIAERQE